MFMHAADAEKLNLHWVLDCALIQPYIEYKFSLMKLRLWSWLWKFILVNSLRFILNTVIKDPCYFSALKEDLSQWICYFPYFSHKNYEEHKWPAGSLFRSFSDERSGKFLNDVSPERNSETGFQNFVDD